FETVYKQQQSVKQSASYVKEEPLAYVPKPVGLRPATGNSAAPQVSSIDSAAKSMVQSEIKEQRTMPEESPKQ
ncbi:hypothetical protein RFX65_12670, partial [Acinetobacter baumannii]|nr:hypothetical protein [Acinetobacter baumannii]